MKYHFTLLLFLLFSLYSHAEVHMANGVKIGSVDQSSAIIWTRLTQNAEGNWQGLAFEQEAKGPLKGHTLDEMEGSVTGATGEVRVTYWTEDGEKISTEWLAVAEKGNFTAQFKIKDLKSGAFYKLIAEGRSGKDTCSVEGSFRTAPDASQATPVSFTVVTGQDYPRRDDKANGHVIYDHMAKLKPDFFVHTGDIEYLDKGTPYAQSIPVARFKWNRIFALPYLRTFHNQTSSYFIKDDHDILDNDCWPGKKYGELKWDEGLAVFKEQFPLGEPFKTISWGKDLQIWIVEGREFRSPNTQKDGPDKSIWGKEQKAWFFNSVKESTATFKVLISATPIVGPDRGNKNDNHANKGFTVEGDEIRKFIGEQKNMYIVCGDRHWQYISVDLVSGAREYSCGPTTDEHASGFKESDRTDMHKYLNIKGGFLEVKVSRENGEPQIHFNHHSTRGTIYNNDVQKFVK